METRVCVRGPMKPCYENILTPEALQFVADLHRRVHLSVKDAMERRREQHARFAAGGFPELDPATREIRQGEWSCEGVEPEILSSRRRVQIKFLGPESRKTLMELVRGFPSDSEAEEDVQSEMNDEELSLAWDSIILEHISLREFVHGDITYGDLEQDTTYSIDDEHSPLLMVCPRPWHLTEPNVEVDGEPVVAAVFDFGLFFFHNHAVFRDRHGGCGPFFHLPQMEHSREAAIWKTVFEVAETAVQAPRHSIRGTLIIETLPAVFQMHEMLYELREHSGGMCAKIGESSHFDLNKPTDRELSRERITFKTRTLIREAVNLVRATCWLRGVQLLLPRDRPSFTRMSIMRREARGSS